MRRPAAVVAREDALARLSVPADECIELELDARIRAERYFCAFVDEIADDKDLARELAGLEAWHADYMLAFIAEVRA